MIQSGSCIKSGKGRRERKFFGNGTEIQEMFSPFFFFDGLFLFFIFILVISKKKNCLDARSWALQTSTLIILLRYVLYFIC